VCPSSMRPGSSRSRALDILQRGGRFVIIAGPLPEPRTVFERAELEVRLDHVVFAADLERALETAADLMRLNPEWKAATFAVPTPR
jgi:hypothetical protein